MINSLLGSASVWYGNSCALSVIPGLSLRLRPGMTLRAREFTVSYLRFTNNLNDDMTWHVEYQKECVSALPLPKTTLHLQVNLLQFVIHTHHRRRNDFQGGGQFFFEVKNGVSAPAVPLARRRGVSEGDVHPSEVGAFLKM